MRKVQRLPEPDSLKNNAGQWTKDLLDEIKSKGAYAKVDRSVKDKYRQEDVKETLEKCIINIAAIVNPLLEQTRTEG